MSAAYRRPAQREATSAPSSRADGQPGTSHAGEAGDAIACLDVLAAHLRARGWTTYINTPAGRLASLFVQDPHHRAESGDILATPDGTTGDWWYWFSWAERITPVHAPAAAADAIIAACQRPADGSPPRRRPPPPGVAPAPVAWPVAGHRSGEAAPPARRGDRVAAAQTPHQARPAARSAVRPQVSLQPG